MSDENFGFVLPGYTGFRTQFLIFLYVILFYWKEYGEKIYKIGKSWRLPKSEKKENCIICKREGKTFLSMVL